MPKLTMAEEILESAEDILEAASSTGILCPPLEGVDTGKGISFYASAWQNKSLDTALPHQFAPVKNKNYVAKSPVANRKYPRLAEQVDWHLKDLALQQKFITRELAEMTEKDTGYRELYAREAQLKYLWKEGQDYLDLCSFCKERDVKWDESHPDWNSFIQYCDFLVPEFLKYKPSDAPVDPVEVELPPPPPPTEEPPPVQVGATALAYRQPGWSEVKLGNQIHWHWCVCYDKAQEPLLPRGLSRHG